MYLGSLDPVSNKATWKLIFEVIDDDTDEAFDISSATTIVLEVEDPRTKSPVLTATLANGKITRPGTTGVFHSLFSASEMGVLCAKTYDVGITVTADSETSQFVIATLPVHDGIVP